jgi:hypothetical protein
VSDVAEDDNIYFEDAIYRPSYAGEIRAGAFEDFRPEYVRTVGGP